jgi:hypothetical protein
MRVISTYMTFYKAVIPTEYWLYELSRALKTETIIKRWTGKNGKWNGLDLVESDGRRAIWRVHKYL